MRPLRLIALCFAVGCLAPHAGADPAGGPFAPVPPTSWPYAAVRELVAADYFTGYPAASFVDGRLTRFDFSVALQRLADQAERRVSQVVGQSGSGLGRALSLDAAERLAGQLDVLERLAAEFSAEYSAAGHDPQELAQRLARLSQRAQQAMARARHDNATNGGARPVHFSPVAARTSGGGSEPLRPLRTDLPTPGFGLRGLAAGLLPGPGAPAGTTARDGVSLTGPLGLTVQVDAPASALPAPDRLPPADPQETRALAARLSVPLGRALVSGFYHRIGDHFANGPGALPVGVPGIQGMAGFGGSVSAPFGSFLRVHLEGGALQDRDREERGGALFVRTGIGLPLGRHSQLGLGYERLQFGSGGLTGDTAEQYNLGLGHAFSQNTSLELRAQFGRLSRSLNGDQNPPGNDSKSYSTVTQFRIRF